jgi:PAS domain S-box-containing protein
MRGRRALAVAAALALAFAASAIRLAFSNAEQPGTTLYAPAVAVVALEFGLVAGVVAGLGVVGLASVTLLHHGELTWVYAVSRGFTFSFLGALIGALGERSRESRRRAGEATAGLLEAQEVAHLGSWEWDLGGKTLRATDELYRIYGLRPGAAIDYEGFIQAVHRDDRPRVDALIRRSIEGGEPFELEHRIVRPDGTERTLHAYGRVRLDEAGRPVRLAGVGHDISASVEADRARRQAGELNDTIVQALVLAKYAAERGEADEARSLVEQALVHARRIIGDLLVGRVLEPGDLRRREAALVGEPEKPE